MGHIAEISTLDFNQYDDFLFLTGGADGIIKLWDMRKLNKSLFDFTHNNDEILKLEWSPFSDTNYIFASSSLDCQLKIWDCSKISLGGQGE